MLPLSPLFLSFRTSPYLEKIKIYMGSKCINSALSTPAVLALFKKQKA